MPKIKNPGAKQNNPISLRLPPEEAAFYRRKASQNGVSLSAYLSKILVAGVVAENVQDVEDRLRSLIDTLPEKLPKTGSGLSDDLSLSLFTCEALLTSIVQTQDLQTLYAAQDVARTKLRKIKGS